MTSKPSNGYCPRRQQLRQSLLHALLGSCLTCALPALSEVPELITDRPDATESPVTVAPGLFQLELGATLTNDESAGVRTESFALPQTLLRIGLSERTELRIGWAGFQDQDQYGGGQSLRSDGAGDTELGVKIALTKSRATGPLTALLVSTSIPSGTADFSTERFDPAFRLAVAHSLSDSIDLGYNVGVVWQSELEETGHHTLTSMIYTLATGFSLSDRWGLFVELFGELGLSETGPPAHSFDGGLTYLLRPNLQLDMAGGVGLSSAADDWFALVGITTRLPR